MFPKYKKNQIFTVKKTKTQQKLFFVSGLIGQRVVKDLSWQ